MKSEDIYEFGVIKERILLEIELKLDPFIKKSQRSSTEILDLLGDIGGFYATADLFLFLLGGYFSNVFYKAAIAKDFYLKKVQNSLAKTFKDEPLNILG